MSFQHHVPPRFMLVDKIEDCGIQEKARQQGLLHK